MDANLDGGAETVHKHAIPIVHRTSVIKKQEFHNVLKGAIRDGGAETVYMNAALTVHRTCVTITLEYVLMDATMDGGA